MDGSAEAPMLAGRQGVFRYSTEIKVFGRDKERATLRHLWAETESRRATVGFVHGPAGFGKTSLLRDFLAAISPAVVFQATCEVDEDAIAYGLVSQLLAGTSLPLPLVLAGVTAGEPAILDPLLVGAALLEFLGTASSSRLVIFVDDIQWADPPSVRALVFALRRMRRDRVLAVLCCRDDAVAGLPVGLLRLVSDVAVQVKLGGLQVDDALAIAEDLGRDELTRAAAARIVELSGGSPLHLRALLTEFTVGELAGDRDSLLPAPHSYADLIGARMADCSSETRDLVEAAAVLGDGLPLRLVARLGGVHDPALALEKSVAAGLLLPVVSRSGVCFEHPLTRSAVFHAIPTARRAELHRDAAVLLAMTDSIGSLRHRVAAAVGFDSALANDVASRADIDAGSGSWLLAAERFRLAAELSVPGSGPMRRFTLQMVECVAQGGELAAIDAARQSIARFEVSALREFTMGRLHALGGAWVAARDRLDAAWALVEPLEDPELAARICAELARAAIMRGRGADGATWAGRALAMQPQNAAVRDDTTALWALSLGIQGRSADALAMMTGLPETIADPSAAQLDQLAGRGMLSLWNADVSQARSDLSVVVAATRGRGPAYANLFAAQYLADAQYRLGDWDSSIVTAEDAAATARDLGNVWTLALLHAVASFPHSARGNFAQAAAHVTAAREAAALVDDVPSRLWTLVAAARLAHARRDFTGVIAALEPMRELKHLDGVREPGIQPWQPMLAAALISLGEFQSAGAVLDEAERFAAICHHPVQLLAVVRERARMHAAIGRPGEGAALLQTAGPLYASAAARPFERAKFDLAAGTVLRRCGRNEEAIAALRRAHAALLALRATPWLDEATAELSQFGAPTPGKDRGSLSKLTPHEVVVARLVRDGLTNREIAAKLVVSVKTVGYHLANVYDKLDVRSRVQLTNLIAGDVIGQPDHS
ncbi:MAG: AAA family ATPase [Nakamurella sp.]